VLALEDELGAPAHRLDEEVQGLKAKLSDQEKEAERLRRELATGGGEEEQPVEVQGLSVVAREVPPAPVPELRRIVDVLRQKLGHGVVVVGAREGEKVTLLAGVEGKARERVHAGKLVAELAGRLGGKGGGRPDFAQAGGRKPELLNEVLESVPGVVESMLG
jgi:alanyl-tRNA synthetase